MATLKICPKCHRGFRGTGALCGPCSRRQVSAPVPWLGIILGLLLAGVIAVMVIYALSPDPQSAVGAAKQGEVPPARPLDLKQAIQAARPGVVRVDVDRGSSGAIGSGFICLKGGYVLTNRHVIRGAVEIAVTDADGHEWAAQVVADKATTDLALLHVPGLAAVTPLPIGSAQHLTEGEQVVAVGSPEGLTNTFSDGIVSALHRTIHVEGQALTDVIQTTAPISHGSSGGPLIEVRTGRVIGITTAGSDSGDNLGFAVSGDAIQSTLLRWSRDLRLP